MLKTLWRFIVSPFVLLLFLLDKLTDAGAWVMSTVFNLCKLVLQPWNGWQGSKKKKVFDPTDDRWNPLEMDTDICIPPMCNTGMGVLGFSGVSSVADDPVEVEVPLTPKKELEEWYMVRAGVKEKEFEVRDVHEIFADLIDEDDDEPTASIRRWIHNGPVSLMPYIITSHESAKDSNQYKIKSTSRGPRGEVVKNNWMARATFGHKRANYKGEEV